MKTTDFFDHIFIPNLPNRPDRKEMVLYEMSQIGADENSTKLTLFPSLSFQDPAGFKNSGARGLFHTYLEMLKLAHASNLRYILFAEDDLRLSNRFLNNEEWIIEELANHEWDFVYLGHLLDEYIPTHTPEKTFFQPLPKECKIHPSATHFFAIKGNIVASLIGYLEEMMKRPPGHPDGGPMHIDGAFYWFQDSYPELKTLIANPSLASQKRSPSDVTPSWYDRTPFLKQLATLARHIRDRKTHP